MTKSDRCDRCSAEALVLLGKRETQLMFCGHHYTEHSEALDFTHWTVIEDNRYDSALQELVTS